MVRILRIIVLLLSTMIFSPAMLAEQPKSIKLAGTHWCPYTCSYQKFSGFVTEYVQELLSREGIELKVDIMPWEVALKKVQQGEYDGLITATPEEAPGLLFTRFPVDIQTSCFYVLKDSDWQYDDTSSLKSQRLGVIKGYAYGDRLDKWLGQPEHSPNIYVSRSQKPLNDLLNQLKVGSISSFVEDRYVLSHFLYRFKEPILPIKQVGCLTANPFYVAFNPRSPHSDVVIKLLSDSLGSSDNRSLKHYIKRRYGLWRKL